MTDEANPKGHGERREGHEDKKEGHEDKKEGHDESREDDGGPCEETYHPSGSRHDLVLPGVSVSTPFTQQQRAKRVPPPAELLHL